VLGAFLIIVSSIIIFKREAAKNDKKPAMIRQI
jgi:hypothetical protein